MTNRMMLLVLVAAAFFSSCAANRDVIRLVQEPDALSPEQNDKVTVSVSKAPVILGASTAATDAGMPSIPYKKFSDVPGVDWTKKVQFSFKEEDIAKLLEFLSNASGLTMVNLGGDVPTSVITDPQSQQGTQQVNQPFYAVQQQQQQQQAKQDPFKHIGPVAGNVTVYSKGQVSLEEAFKILDVVLLSKGYSAILTGSVMKIVPVAGLRQANLRIVVNADPLLATEGDDVVLQIIPLKNLTASKIRLDLSSLIPLWGMILSNDSSNSLIMINSLSNIKTLLTIIDSLEKASTRALSVNIYPLKFGDSKNLANVLNQVFNNASTITNQANQQFRGPQYGLGGTQQPGETVTIVAEATSNTLIAVATPQTLSLIRTTLEQLDRKQSQVLVEVLVVDVTLTKDLALGVEWSLPGIPKLGGVDYNGTFSNSLALSGKTPDFQYALLQGNTSAIIHSLMQETKVDVKSAPKILTLDNQKATVTVGQQVPNVTGSQTTSGGQVIYTYNYNTVGTTLEVTPHINQDNFVTMTVHQNVSKITSTTYFGAPVLDNRDAVTSVRVKDGETMVLGGIMTDQSLVTENKVPILGDIPLIGFLFNSSQTTKEKTELLIFLTPHIIDNAKDSGETVRSMERRMEKLGK